MKYQKHYLSEKGNDKLCPLNTNSWKCDSYCAWFDHEEQDCRMIGGFWKVTTAIHNFADIIEALEYYKEKLEK